jgi:hypothetical protein
MCRAIMSSSDWPGRLSAGLQHPRPPQSPPPAALPLPAPTTAGEYLLSVLIINKPTYKGLIVPGGKVDM